MGIEGEPFAHGGLVATYELHAAGYDRAAIARAVRARRIHRVRQGWYSAPDLAPILARAARVGGLATCATALAARGVWVLPDSRLHVAVPPHACQLRSPVDSRKRLDDAAVIHWTLDADEGRLMRPLAESLLDFAACAAPEFVAASADSMLREHPEMRALWPALRRRFPQRMQNALSLVDGVCESGSEFLFWSRSPKRRRSGMRRQVWIPGVGRVDFLIGEQLVVEIDGFTYHGGRDEFEEDRGRDALVSVAGFRSLRFSHKLVVERWPVVEAAVSAAIARGDHL